MNYIQWELLRQRESLRRLLSAGTAPDAAETALEAAETSSVPETAAESTSRETAAEAALRRSGTAESGEDGTDTGALPAADGPTPERRRGRTAAAAGTSPAAGSGTAPDGWGVLSERDALAVVSGGETPVEALASARTVSRCAERDARRYDGGYPLY